MRRSLMLFGMFSFFLSCEKEDVAKPSLIGKWEAIYMAHPGRDTLFFREGTMFPCAYMVLPFEYNSGFEIIDDTKGELIWCGGNKGQFFKWSYEENLMTIKWHDRAYEISVNNLTDTSLCIKNDDGSYFLMKKY